MKKIMLLLLLVICTTTFASAQSRSKALVAVYVTGKMDNVDRKVISSKAMAYLVRSEKYIALERTDSFLNAIMKEQDYQLSGEVSDSQMLKLGQNMVLSMWPFLMRIKPLMIIAL